ncbi:hypothetical protein GA0115239_11966 [Streptomyces sp. BpilaLS-43]|nr:hypothetical protein GA0115239_11966 [Streptomyces sp. BpilaLS-43]
MVSFSSASITGTQWPSRTRCGRWAAQPATGRRGTSACSSPGLAGTRTCRSSFRTPPGGRTPASARRSSAPGPRPGSGQACGMTGQPLPQGLGGGVGQVLEERGGRPHAVLLVGEQQVPGVLVQHAQPGRGRTGAEEERLRPRVRPPGQLRRVVRAEVGEGGQLQNPGCPAGQRHQQLSCHVQEFGVQVGGSVLLGTGAVQGARRCRVQGTPRVEGFVLRGTEPQARQPLGEPPRLTAPTAAGFLDLAAERLGRRRDRLPARAGSRGPPPGVFRPAGDGLKASTAASRPLAADCKPGGSFGAPGSFSRASAALPTHASTISPGSFTATA